MNHQDPTRKNDFEEAADALRRESPEPSAVDAAAERVWKRLEETAAAGSAPVAEHEPIRGCADFQSLLPEYRSGTLPPARRALLDDHIHECVACRKALWKTASPQTGAVPTPARRLSGKAWRWAAAAAAVLVLAAVFQLGLLDRLFISDAQARAVAERLDGRLYRVNAKDTVPIADGQEITADQVVRTARGARAVLRLADGSRIEMNERAELALQPRRDGVCVALRQGAIIVEAAKQADGRHLFVDTADCLVSVKGTVFSVTCGTKGSRVSVLQGEVWVDSLGETTVLLPGQQVATHSSIGPMPIDREVAWSEHSAEYDALLRQVKDVGRELMAKMTTVPLRFDSGLLNLVPENASVLITVPNITGDVATAGVKIRDLVQQNPEFRAAWDRNKAEHPGLPDFDEMIARFQELGAHLGDELVLAVNLREPQPGFLLLSRVSDPAGLRAALDSDLARLQSLSKKDVPVIVTDDAGQIPAAGGKQVCVLLAGDHLAVSTDGDMLREFSRNAAAKDAAFTRTPFGRQIAAAYEDGVGWLLAADLQALRAPGTIGPAGDPGDVSAEALGLNDLRYVLVEQKSVRQQPQLRATLSFAGERRGIPSWLSAPAPMGTLEFVSPQASLAACVVVKEPTAILDELMTLLQDNDSQALTELLEFQSEHGIDFRQDLAEPLGGEFLVAVDGPILPMPSWKVVLLVDDPVRFQATIQTMLAEANRELAAEGKPTLALHAETVDGVPYYRLSSGDEDLSVHYVYWEGYLVAAPSRVLLTEAIRNRANGYTLPQSEAFQSALPVDGNEQFSALLYQNLQQLTSSVAGFVPSDKGGAKAEEIQKVKEMLANAKPMILSAYAGKDRITVAWAGLGGLNPLDLSGFEKVSRLVGRGHSGLPAGAPAD